MVREVPDQNGHEAYRSLVLRYGSRDANGETTLSIKEMNFNSGEEFNLLRTVADPSATEQPVILKFPPDAPVNQPVHESTQKVQAKGERRGLDGPQGNKQERRQREGQGQGKEKGKRKGKGKGKENEQGKGAGKAKSSQEPFRGTCRNTNGANDGRKAAEPRNKRTLLERD